MGKTKKKYFGVLVVLFFAVQSGFSQVSDYEVRPKKKVAIEYDEFTSMNFAFTSFIPVNCIFEEDESVDSKIYANFSSGMILNENILHVGFFFDWTVTDNNYIITFNPKIGCQLPIQFNNKFYIVPGINAGGVLSLGGDYPAFGWEWEGFIRYYFHRETGIGLSYFNRTIYSMKGFESKYDYSGVRLFFCIQSLYDTP